MKTGGPSSSWSSRASLRGASEAIQGTTLSYSWGMGSVLRCAGLRRLWALSCEVLTVGEGSAVASCSTGRMVCADAINRNDGCLHRVFTVL